MALEKPTIVQAALQLLDKVGLEGLSTRKLAQDLGVQGPSLYWHFKSKRELLNYMAEAMLMEHLPSPGPMESDQPWDEWLRAGAYCIRAAALSRRDGAQVLAAARPTGANQALSMPGMLRHLMNEGFGEAAAHHALFAIGSFAIGYTLIEQSGMTESPHEDHAAGFAYGLQALISGLGDQLALGDAALPPSSEAAGARQGKAGAGARQGKAGAG